MVNKRKEIENIYIEGNKVIFIIKNVNIRDNFSRSINPMLKRSFNKWIQNSKNRDKIKWTYISRWRIIHNDDYNLGYQDKSKMYYRYKGIIEII